LYKKGLKENELKSVNFNIFKTQTKAVATETQITSCQANAKATLDDDDPYNYK